MGSNTWRVLMTFRNLPRATKAAYYALGFFVWLFILLLVIPADMAP